MHYEGSFCVSAVEIKSILLLLIQGSVHFKQGLCLENRICEGREGKRTDAMLLMPAGCQRLISREVTVQATTQLWVKEAVFHPLVLPSCCLPYHLQLNLYIPKDKEEKCIRQVQAGIRKWEKMGRLQNPQKLELQGLVNKWLKKLKCLWNCFYYYLYDW